MFYLLYVFALFADFLSIEMGVAQVKADDETAALAQFAFYLDGAVVQFDDAFRQGQTDAGAYTGGETVHLLCLIETVEYLIYFFGIDTATSISHANYGFIAFGGDAECDGIFGLGMLDGIG